MNIYSILASSIFGNNVLFFLRIIKHALITLSCVIDGAEIETTKKKRYFLIRICLTVDEQ